MELRLKLSVTQLAGVCNWLVSQENHLVDGHGPFAQLLGVKRHGGPEFRVTLECRTEFVDWDRLWKPISKKYLDQLLEAAKIYE